MPISLHEEDKAFITNNGINAGEISTQLGVAGSPAIAEEVMVAVTACLHFEVVPLS